MSATTEKLEPALLSQIQQVIPAGQTLSAFVREVLQRDLCQRRLRESALAYQELLATDPDELTETRAWHSAKLASPPKRKRR